MDNLDYCSGWAGRQPAMNVDIDIVVRASGGFQDKRLI
jgi:hypothetical protein